MYNPVFGNVGVITISRGPRDEKKSLFSCLLLSLESMNVQYIENTGVCETPYHTLATGSRPEGALLDVGIVWRNWVQGTRTGQMLQSRLKFTDRPKTRLQIIIYPWFWNCFAMHDLDFHCDLFQFLIKTKCNVVITSMNLLTTSIQWCLMSWMLQTWDLPCIIYKIHCTDSNMHKWQLNCKASLIFFSIKFIILQQCTVNSSESHFFFFKFL